MGELKGLKEPWRHMKRNKDIDESQAEGRHEGNTCDERDGRLNIYIYKLYLNI